jgi:hypothetical protein
LGGLPVVSPQDLAPAAGGTYRGQSRNNDHEDADESCLHLVLLSLVDCLVQSDYRQRESTHCDCTKGAL